MLRLSELVYEAVQRFCIVYEEANSLTLRVFTSAIDVFWTGTRRFLWLIASTKSLDPKILGRVSSTASVWSYMKGDGSIWLSAWPAWYCPTA